MTIVSKTYQELNRKDFKRELENFLISTEISLPNRRRVILRSGEYNRKDPWDNDYLYESSDGKKFNIVSFGSDLAEGGEGKDADIYLYEQKNN